MWIKKEKKKDQVVKIMMCNNLEKQAEKEIERGIKKRYSKMKKNMKKQRKSDRLTFKEGGKKEII